MTGIIKITSRTNNKIKDICFIKENPLAEQFWLEGKHFVKDIDNEQIQLLVFTDPSGLEDKIDKLCALNIPVYNVTPDVMKKLCDTTSIQNIGAIVKKPFVQMPDKLILLDRLQDPGNAGTIIRTAAAFGYGVIFGEGSVNPFSSKVVRSSAGIINNCFVKSGNLEEEIPKLKSDGFKIFAAMLDKSSGSLNKLNKNPNIGIIIGNEGEGVSEKIASLSDKKVYIPINNNVESLNAAVAAAIFMYSL